MTYVLSADKHAMDYLENLESQIRVRITKKIFLSKEDPYHFFSRLAGRPDFRLRVGDYRIIADISDEERLIRITRIGHRKDIYKR